MPEIRIREHRNFIKTKSREESENKAANEQAAESAEALARESLRRPHPPKTKIHPWQHRSDLPEKQPIEQARKVFRQESRRRMAAAQQKRTAAQFAHMAGKAGAAVLRAVKNTGSFLAGILGGMTFVAVVAVVVVLGAILASPLGILFSNSSSRNAVPLSSAVSQINMELDARLRSLQSETMWISSCGVHRPIGKM